MGLVFQGTLVLEKQLNCYLNINNSQKIYSTIAQFFKQCSTYAITKDSTQYAYGAL